MAEPGRRLPRVRAVAHVAAAVLACVLVWAALVAPNRLDRLGVGAFVSIPLEGLVVVALALVVGPRVRRMAAVLFGVVLGLLVVVKVLDIGFVAVLDRPFDPLNDWAYLGPAVGVLGDSIGPGAASATAAAAVVLAIVVLVLLVWAALRVTRLAADHRRVSARVVTGLGVAWVLAAVTGLQVAGADTASTGTAGLAVTEVNRVRADLHDRAVFADAIAADGFATIPDDQLLRGLRGKDVLLVFVESYGRVAVQGTSYSPGIDAVLHQGTRRLRQSGFAARSAFLTSPTFGAGSWLAHGTLQSGLWADSQQRYDQLLSSDRLTLTRAFARAGWRTVFDVPANTRDWPEGAAFYDWDALYDSRNVGYRGPEFGYAPIPDQYTLAAFQRNELAPRHRLPVMAEIDLVSSHHPWAPLPRHVPWDRVGDGSVFDGMPERGESSDAVLGDADLVRSAYGRSIEYSWRTLVSFIRRSHDPDLVLVVLGDHQPHSYVTGPHPGHDVPVSIIARDRAVTKRIADWGWQPGLRPRPDAPVWRMDAFRDRFLAAYGSAPPG